MPTTKEMFLNLTGTALDALQLAIKNKVVFADENTILHRIDLCSSCPEYITGSFGTERCGICGCGMKLKVRIAAASCPIKKWDKFNKKEPDSGSLYN